MSRIRSIAAWTALFASSAFAQTAAPTATQSPAPPSAPSTAAVVPDTAAPTAPQPSAATVEVPAGTKVLLALRSAVNTKTAHAGDGVYLTSSFPVVANNHVVIPAGVYVQGVLDSVVRPGHVKGRAQVTMHFTTLIFPNGSVVSIPGTVDSIPGSSGPQVKDGEGTIEQEGNKGKDAGKVLAGAASGAGLGGIIGATSGHPIAGVAYGALAGGVGGLLYTLFTRGNEIMLDQGQTIEMVFQRPLLLQEANLTLPDSKESVYTGLTPVPRQPQPMPKPHPQVLCPNGLDSCR